VLKGEAAKSTAKKLDGILLVMMENTGSLKAD